jgi:catechol 1,2-dioxygenase
MNRRTFLKNSSLTAVGVAAFGSVKLNGKQYEPKVATTSDILGPFYRPEAPLRKNLIPHGAAGDILNVEGRIFKDDGTTPLSDVLIESWQCDPHEQYDNISDDYLYRGAQKTDEYGRYEFRTLIPPPYPNGDEGDWRPAHIHYRISSPEYQDLITQVYFQGDPHIEGHPASASPISAHRILEVKNTPEGEKRIGFDIVMQKSFPLDLSTYQKITGLYQLDSGMAEFNQIDDLLYIKLNGLILEGMVYKGENVFEGAFGANRVKFDLLENGKTKCHIKLWDYPNYSKWVETYTGEKFIKYSD